MIRQARLRQARLALCLLPNNLEQLNEESVHSLVDQYNDDLPQLDTFTQELGLWRRKWRNTTEKKNGKYCRHTFGDL